MNESSHYLLWITQGCASHRHVGKVFVVTAAYLPTFISDRATLVFLLLIPIWEILIPVVSESIFPELADRDYQERTCCVALELGVSSGAVCLRHSVAKMKASAAKHLSDCLCRKICTGVFGSNDWKVIRSTQMARFGEKTHNCAVSVEFDQVLTVPERLWWCGCLRSGSDVYTALTWGSAGFVIGVLVNITTNCTEEKAEQLIGRSRAAPEGRAWAEWRWMM